MILTQLVSQLVEMGANRLITLDPDSLKRLENIQGSIIKLELQGLQLGVYILVHAAEIELMSKFEGEVDTVISGKPTDMIALGRGQGDLFSNKFSISGDIKVAKEFQCYLQSIDIDWEGHLSNLIGDKVAYQLGAMLSKVNSYVDKTGQSLQDNVSEYLVEKTRSVPANTEIEIFLSTVDELNVLLNGLEKRIFLLEKIKDKRS